jgi:hypothetical protein
MGPSGTLAKTQMINQPLSRSVGRDLGDLTCRRRRLSFEQVGLRETTTAVSQTGRPTTEYNRKQR